MTAPALQLARMVQRAVLLITRGRGFEPTRPTLRGSRRGPAPANQTELVELRS
jgi:hypothetical protein